MDFEMMTPLLVYICRKFSVAVQEWLKCHVNFSGTSSAIPLIPLSGAAVTRGFSRNHVTLGLPDTPTVAFPQPRPSGLCLAWSLEDSKSSRARVRKMSVYESLHKIGPYQPNIDIFTFVDLYLGYVYWHGVNDLYHLDAVMGFSHLQLLIYQWKHNPPGIWTQTSWDWSSNTGHSDSLHVISGR